jgi:thiamine biosynthesis protein ThiI
VPPYVLVHYSEIGLKGKNRPYFERQLQHNIGASLAGLGVSEVRRLHGRLLVILEPGAGEAAILERLRTVPGVAYFAPAHRAPRNMEALAEAVVEAVRGRSPRSFRIAARRADKQFPLISQEINTAIGSAVQSATGWQVDLSAPELVVHIEVLSQEILFYFDRVDGLGGLPVGASGTVGLLLSGGIDSPVAAYYALKRGCRVLPIHFHSGPFGYWLSSENKIRRLVTALGAYGLAPRYYVVPIGESQQQIVANAPMAARVLLYRRLMFRLAEALTRREGGLALVTGENLGQVASQTLESLRVIEAVTTLPVLRPLIGFDKLEIMAQAQVMGTYEVSIESGDDCCQFLMPRRVLTRPTLDEVEAAEVGLDVAAMVEAGLAAARLETVG